MNPRSYQGLVDIIGVADRISQVLSSDGLALQRIGSEDFLYLQVRRNSGGGGRLKRSEPAFTIRLQRVRGETIVSVGQSRWAEKPAVSLIAFYPLISGRREWFDEYNLSERIYKIIDNFLLKPSTSTGLQTMKAWELGAVQNAMTSSLAKSGSSDLLVLARESNNNLSIVTWMAEKLAANGNSYVLTTDKQVIFSRAKVKDMIVLKLDSRGGEARRNFCSKCGKSLLVGDRFCKACGTKVGP